MKKEITLLFFPFPFFTLHIRCVVRSRAEFCLKKKISQIERFLFSENCETNFHDRLKELKKCLKKKKKTYSFSLIIRTVIQKFSSRLMYFSLKRLHK